MHSHGLLVNSFISKHPARSLAGIDLRWVKILRSMRVLRVGLLSGELRSLHLRWAGGVVASNSLPGATVAVDAVGRGALACAACGSQQL